MQTLPSKTQVPVSLPIGRGLPVQFDLKKSHLQNKRCARKTRVATHAQLGSKKLMAASVATPKVKADAPNVALTEGNIKLPKFTEDLASAVLSEEGMKLVKEAGDVIGEDRDVGAYVMYPTSLEGKKGPFPVVLFSHGFSQPPTNYLETLRAIAKEHEAYIIAPNTSIFDIANPFKTVGGSGKSKKPPTKMQAALLVDVLRSAAYLHAEGIKASKISLVGHSMGAGLSIVTAPLLKNVGGVMVEAPAVKQLMEFPLNPYIHMSSDILGRNYKEAQTFFRDVFPDAASLHLIGGDQDLIVQPLEVAKLFSAARDAVDQNKLQDVTLFRVKGSHIGFEDKLSLEPSPLTNNFITKPIFAIINFLVYKVEILKALFQDPSDQVAASRYIINKSMAYVLGGPPFPSQDTSNEDAYDIKGFTDPNQLPEDAKAQIDLIIEAASQLPPTEDPSKDPPSAWLPATSLLLAYTAGQALNSFSAFKLMLEGGFLSNLDSNGGMAVVAGIAFALVYENALLAGGRFIGVNPLLQALSQFRFVGHAFVPALAFVAAEMAARGGVTWATGSAFEGFIGVGAILAITFSFLSAQFLLETQVLYAKGIVRYGYKDPSFIQVVPVISTSLLIIALGLSGKEANPALQPLAFGPILSFILAAIPSKLVPQFLVGNLGEVILLASIIAAEVGLRAQGL